MNQNRKPKTSAPKQTEKTSLLNTDTRESPSATYESSSPVRSAKATLSTASDATLKASNNNKTENNHTSVDLANNPDQSMASENVPIDTNSNGKKANIPLESPNSAPDERQSASDINDITNEDEIYTFRAHLLRRVYHVVMFTTMPLLWYGVLATDFADAIGVRPEKILSFVIIVSVCGEYLRMRKGWITFGMRPYERDHVSANAWGAISAALVALLAFPRTYSIGAVDEFENTSGDSDANFACNGQIAIPIIWSLGFGDPILGELKQLARDEKISWKIVYLGGWLTIFSVWMLCWLWCDTPWWLMILMPPIAIIAEKPSIPHIDDNGLMQLVPLVVTLLFEPWFSKTCDPIFY